MIVEYIGKCPGCKYDLFENNKYKDKVNGLSADDLFQCPKCTDIYCIIEIEKYQRELEIEKELEDYEV